MNRGSAAFDVRFVMRRAAALCRRLALVALVGTAPSLAIAAAAAEAPDVSRGRALFSGDTPLQARIAGHADQLPPFVAACAACHGVPAVADARSTDAPSTAPLLALAAPELRHGWLAKTLSRRNGPPAAYDAAALCRALRTGVDPAFVVLPARMPRFSITDEDCTALWHFLGGQQ